MEVKVEHVSKKIKNSLILQDINLLFKSGNIYGLYGRNGSGKSVLLKLIAGFYIPTEGKVLYDNIDLNAKNEFFNDIRVLIEKPTFFPDLTGYENLKILADIQKKIGEKEILNALEVVNLIKEKDKKYCKYSLGMKQKLGVAQVIMENPKVMILDEPFNGIENDTVVKLIDYLKEKVLEDKIIIVSSHILEDLKSLTNNIIYIDVGKITNDKR